MSRCVFYSNVGVAMETRQWLSSSLVSQMKYLNEPQISRYSCFPVLLNLFMAMITAEFIICRLIRLKGLKNFTLISFSFRDDSDSWCTETVSSGMWRNVKATSVSEEYASSVFSVLHNFYAQVSQVAPLMISSQLGCVLIWLVVMKCAKKQIIWYLLW
jgi:hypothetical protein